MFHLCFHENIEYDNQSSPYMHASVYFLHMPGERRLIYLLSPFCHSPEAKFQTLLEGPAIIQNQFWGGSGKSPKLAPFPLHVCAEMLPSTQVRGKITETQRNFHITMAFIKLMRSLLGSPPWNKDITDCTSSS